MININPVKVALGVFTFIILIVGFLVLSIYVNFWFCTGTLVVCFIYCLIPEIPSVKNWFYD